VKGDAGNYIDGVSKGLSREAKARITNPRQLWLFII